MTRPLIIYSRKTISDIRQCVLDNFGFIKYELPFINALCIEASDEAAAALRNNKRVALVTDDAEVTKLASCAGGSRSTRKASHAEARMFQSIGKRPFMLRGSGVSIAIIDTGISPHYDLVKPVNRIVAFKDFIEQKATPYDDDGHGTHVAGIAAGNGYSCMRNHIGTAPDANIVALKSLDSRGNGLTSDILAAMQWALHHKDTYNIKVVNLSLGISSENRSMPDPLILGATSLVKNGITVVTAAGNSGPGRGTITSPGVSPYVITVGSANKTLNGIPNFSSRGPTPSGLKKPDVIAPGVDIVSLDTATYKGYVTQSGTSMSAPHISGIAACLHAAFPHLSPAQVKRIILSNASPIRRYDRNTQGHGLIVARMFD